MEHKKKIVHQLFTGHCEGETFLYKVIWKRICKKKNFFDSVELFEFVEFSKGKSIFAFSAVVHDVKTTVKNMNTEDRERGSFAWLSESKWILVRLYFPLKSQQ